MDAKTTTVKEYFDAIVPIRHSIRETFLQNSFVREFSAVLLRCATFVGIPLYGEMRLLFIVISLYRLTERLLTIIVMGQLTQYFPYYTKYIAFR